MTDIKKDEDVSTKDEDVSTNFIQSVKKFDLLIKSTGILPTENLTFEELAGYIISVKISDLSVKYSNLLNNKTDLALDLAVSRFLQLLYKEIKTLDVLLRPKESVREIIDVVGEYGIVSAKMVTTYAINDQIRTKNTARKLLRQLNRAGLLFLYPTKPMIENINKPLASLHRTELYGFPGLNINAYNNVIEFYKDLTEKAHEDVRLKQRAHIDTSNLKIRVDPKDLLNERNRLKTQIKSYEDSYYSCLQSPSMLEKAQAPMYKDKADKLQDRLNEVITKLKEVDV